MEKVAKFIILACLFLSCEKEYETQKHCINMEVSNSLPIQLWANGEQTFNEKDVCGITKVCWCQPIKSTDTIVLEFTDSVDRDYYLFIVNTSDLVIAFLPFTKTTVPGGYKWDISFNMYDSLVIDEQVHIVISNQEESYALNSDFTSTVDGWYQISPATDNWGWGNSPDYFSDGGGYVFKPQESFEFTPFNHSISLVSGESITIETEFGGLTDGEEYTLQVYITESALVASQIGSYAFTKNAGLGQNTMVVNDDIVLPAGAIGDVFNGVYFILTGGIGAGNVVYVNYFRVTHLSIGNNIVGKSDCLSIKENHPCTMLIDYSNATAFDGIPDSSPMTSFSLRIPAVFFEEENTTEQEDIELSDDTIVRLYDKVEEKRLMRIGFMPHYMHRKVLLALAYDFVTIDGKEWIRRDEYKKNEGSRHYPLKTAQVLLTDKNFIKENQL